MRIIFASVFIFGMLLQSFGQEKQWTLSMCIDYAIENNIILQKQELAVQMYANNLEMTKSEILPNANASIGTGMQFGKSFNEEAGQMMNERDTYFNTDITANMTLFDGFRIQNTIEQRDLELGAAKEDVQVQANNIALGIVNDYLQVIYNREQIVALQQQLEVTNKQISRTEELARAGSVPKGDVLELKAQAASEKSQITSYRNLERQALTNLKQSMNLFAGAFDVAAPPKIDVDSLYVKVPERNEVYNTALDYLPDIRAAQAAKDAKLYSVEVAKSGYYPSVNLQAAISTNYRKLNTQTDEGFSFADQLNDNRNALVGLSVNIPIFNRFQTRHQVQNAQIDYQMADQDLLLAKQDIFKKIETASNEVEAAYDSYQAALENVSASKESFRYAEQKFTAGLMNSVDYNLAKSNLTNAEASLVRARYELIFKVKILDFYMGADIEL